MRFTRHPAPFHISGALRFDPFLICRRESGGPRCFSISLWFYCCPVGGAPLEFPETDKRERAAKVGNHGPIRDSRPIAFLDCPRGHRVIVETRCRKLHSLPNVRVDTLPRIRTSQEPDWANRQGPSLPQEGIERNPLKTLKLLVVSDVGYRNSLLSSRPST